MWPITTIFVGLYDVVLTCNRSSIKTKRNEEQVFHLTLQVSIQAGPNYPHFF